MIHYFLLYLTLLSFITLIIYGIDKARARRGLWRISERTLLTLSFVGGALGGLIAMQLFRHKTKHWYFVLWMPLFTVLYAILSGYLFMK